MFAKALPAPCIEERTFGQLNVLTDNALAELLGVRIAFSTRAGGASEGAFASLNLGGHVGDDALCVQENRRRLLAALGGSDIPAVVPRQIHGDRIVSVDSARETDVARAREDAQRGADGVLVCEPGIAALLCFADCVPVILVSPSGSFCVVHAGWRGVVAHIAVKAASRLASLDARRFGVDASRALREINVYIGPCIRGECFEVGADVRETFSQAFGPACLAGDDHVDLPAALALDLAECGVAAERIADAGRCTVCDSDAFFSYRASRGTCGRHGAVAFRKDGLR